MNTQALLHWTDIRTRSRYPFAGATAYRSTTIPASCKREGQRDRQLRALATAGTQMPREYSRALPPPWLACDCA